MPAVTSTPSDQAADGAPFSFTCPPLSPDHFRVRRVRGREGMSEPYRFVVEVTATPTSHDAGRGCVGRRAALELRTSRTPRIIHGVVERVRAAKAFEADAAARFRIELVPALALLRHQRGSRIFQDRSVDQVVEEVLRAAGIATRWRLSRSYPARAYITQYEETDLGFVQRLLAEAGIFYAFESEGLHEVVVFGDAVAAYEALPHPLHFSAATGLALDRRAKVISFSSARRVRSEVAEYREFDPERPLVPIISRAPGDPAGLVAAVAGAAASAVAEFTAAVPAPPVVGAMAQGVAAAANAAVHAIVEGLSSGVLETYEHHGQFLFPDWKEGASIAGTILAQRTRDRDVSNGQSFTPALAPGKTFRLEDHPIDDWNRAYAVTAVRHRARVQGDEDLYENHFVCVPAEVAYPPARPRRANVQSLLTATVVGPIGEEIHVDPMGRIKVFFHWDRRFVLDGNASCWVRCIHPWAGAGFGHQFIPRVGMEVAIAFEGGDPDKPVCVGALYNATHPSPFPLPLSKTQSGIRTQSSPGGAGYNELSFDDAAGAERVFVHAQRDLEEVVEHDHTRTVHADENIFVQGSRKLRVKNEDHAEVDGARHEIVAGDVSIRHARARLDVIEGALDERVGGARTARVEGPDRLDVRGEAQHAFRADLTTRVIGNHTIVVGDHDAQRSFALRVEGDASLSTEQGLVLEAKGGLTLRCGETSIRIGPDGIELTGGAVRATGEKGGLEASKDGLKLSSQGAFAHLGDKLLVKTGGASLSMGSEIKLDGGKILLNSPDVASEEPPPEPKPKTEIELVDEDGKPVARQPFVIVLDDGTERSGVTDAEGKAALDLPSNGEIRFAGLHQVESG
jgi:type VI secretion system secreted protein VgrG